MASNDKNYMLVGINSRLDIEEETITKLESTYNGNNSNSKHTQKTERKFKSTIEL